jgi:DNA-binding CsgD family transcriptional regulator
LPFENVMSDLLLERAEELAQIDRALRLAHAGHGRILLVSAPAGHGKTALLDYARTRAEAAGLAVLAAAGEEHERSFTFGLIQRLFEWSPDHDALHQLSGRLRAVAPALIVADDLQWADAESLECLAFAARRLRRTGIALVAATHDGDAGGLEKAGAIMLEPRPLSERAVAALLHVELGPVADSAFVRACHELTHGHPLLVCELARAARRERAADWQATIVPAGVASFAARRLEQLPRDARELAHAVALLGKAALRHAAALAGLGADAAAAACDHLRRAGLLAGGAVLEITPPLLARALYAAIPPARRARLHALAARHAEPEHHLLRSEPATDPWVATTLLRAARRELDAGRPAAARTLLRRAAREGVVDGRANVLVTLAAAERRLGDAAEIEHLEAALDWGAPATDALARALLAHGRVTEALALPAADSAEVYAGARLSPGLGAEVAARLGGEGPAVAACRAAEAVLRGASATVASALARSALSGLDPESPAYFLACLTLTWSDRLTLAREHLQRAREHARRVGSVPGLTGAETGLAAVALRSGALEEAVTCASSAGDAAHVRAVTALALIELDRHDVAAAAGGTAGRYAQGCLRLARWDPGGALEDFLAAGRDLTADAITCPAVAPWRSSAALALAATGRTSEAVTLAQDEYALAERFGAPGAVGRALRVLAAVGPTDERTERCRAAAGVLAPSERRLEYAHALCDLGSSLRRERARRAAREPLREALDLAARCGAVALTRRVREELAASGARPRRAAQHGRDALTPAELRVARLAANGLANREIATTLVVTVKTVETELGHVYAKLGIRSRRELGGALRQS